MELVLSNTYNGKPVTIKVQPSGILDAVGDGFSVWGEQIAFGKLLKLQVPVTAEEETVIMGMSRDASAARAAEIAAERNRPGIPAKFAGTCAKSGIRYQKGARIERTEYGWALVGAELDVHYNMSREDSHL